MSTYFNQPLVPSSSTIDPLEKMEPVVMNTNFRQMGRGLKNSHKKIIAGIVGSGILLSVGALALFLSLKKQQTDVRSQASAQPQAVVSIEDHTRPENNFYEYHLIVDATTLFDADIKSYDFEVLFKKVPAVLGLTSTSTVSEPLSTPVPQVACWNTVIEQGASLFWPDSCRGITGTTGCAQVLTPLNQTETNKYLYWKKVLGAPAIAGCSSLSPTPVPTKLPTPTPITGVTPVPTPVGSSVPTAMPSPLPTPSPLVETQLINIDGITVHTTVASFVKFTRATLGNAPGTSDLLLQLKGDVISPKVYQTRQVINNRVVLAIVRIPKQRTTAYQGIINKGIVLGRLPSIGDTDIDLTKLANVASPTPSPANICQSNADCALGYTCYQPPVPSCPPGQVCPIPAKFCRVISSSPSPVVSLQPTPIPSPRVTPTPSPTSFVTPVPSPVASAVPSPQTRTGFSDLFNGSVLSQSWNFVNPTGKANYALTNGHLELTIPAGATHDCWTTGDLCPRLMQTSVSGNGTYTVKVDGENLTQNFQSYGLFFYQDSKNFARFEFSQNGELHVMVYRVKNGAGSRVKEGPKVTLTNADSLRVTRTGQNYLVEYQQGGGAWQPVATVTLDSFDPGQVGIYALSAGSNPGLVARFDSFEAISQ